MVTRSSLVWVMTGIAAGIAGGWLWNRERGIEVTPPTAAESRSEPIRSPFTQRRDERASYLTRGDAARDSVPAQASGRIASEFSHRQTVYQSASSADREHLDAMIAEARRLANPVERRSTLEILLLRYAELDMDGALDQALDNDRQTAAQLLAALADVAPEQTWQRALQVTNPAERLAYLRTVGITWVAQDPQRAFAKVSGLPADWQRAELLRSVTLGIADLDPRLAIRLAQSQPPVASGALIELIATQWSRHNPSEAGRWIEELPRVDQGRYAYRISEAYLAQKPSEALSWALRLAGSPERYLWSSMLGQMARYDPDQALQLAQSAESPAQRAQALGQVLAAIAQTNPSMAMAQLQKLPSGRARSQALYQIASSVAMLTPTAALDWLNGIDDKALQAEAAQSLGNTLAERNVEAAAQLVDRVPRESRAAWINAVAVAYASVDIDKGRQWVRRYGSDENGTAVQFANMVAMRNPEAAVKLIDEVSDDRERDRMLSGMLQPLAMNSPELAARLVERVTNDETRASSTGQIASMWAQYDLPAARKWVLSLDDGPPKDAALASLVGRAGSLDDVLPIINQIQTPERRTHAVLMAAMSLSRSDMEEARTLLRRYPLDPARQRQFDEYVQRRNKGQ
jgi:hypothetical protein